MLHEIRTDLAATTRPRTGMAGFEPLGSPSVVSPLMSRLHGAQQGTYSPISPTTDWSRHRSPLEERRSMDGGVRLAGGPPRVVGGVAEDDDVRSAVSTLPPSYQLYPSARKS